MKLLLDTHTWLWMVQSPERLSDKVRDAVQDGSHALLLSVASLWEIAIKVSTRKLTVGRRLEDFVPDALARSGVRTLPIEVEHALAVAELPQHHRDPFDRLLAAQAMAGDLTLLTRDPLFAPYGVRLLWD